MHSNIFTSYQNEWTVDSRRNKFESFEEFQEFVRTSFIKGSGVDPELFDACVEFHQDQEFGYGGEVTMPIHDALGWDFKRFGHQASENLYAAFLKNEDGSIWQAVVSVWDEDRQRPYRYLAPKGIGDRAFLPPVPLGIRKRIADRYGIEVPTDSSFWEWVKDIDIPRVATEGGKKGLCGLSHGYVAIALYGCTCGAKNKDEQDLYVKPYLTSDLEQLATPESRWLFAFDRDDKHKAKLSVATGKKKLRQALGSAGCFTADIMWKSEQGKGVDDLMVNNGSGNFDAAYQKAISSLEKQFRSDSASEPQQAYGKKKQYINLLNSRWGEQLRFNEMTLAVELEGKPLDLDTLSMRLAEEFYIDVGKDTACELVLFLAKRQTYHPVREYLERVAAQHSGQDLSILDDVATRYFGSSEPLHNIFMRKHLIGQVKRIFEPGCQHDTAVVLQGGQGIRKSSFWRTLAVDPDWFDDSVTSGSDKDDRLKLRRFWILELAEIESVFRRKEIASFRGFFTTKTDNLRVPYGRSVEGFPRTSCFVGSVNPMEFLCDPEGHRRYWVIPVKVDRIPIEQLEVERDLLWSAAVMAYRMGETNYLNPDLEKQNATLNKEFEMEDSWQELIDVYLETVTETTVNNVLIDCLKIEIARHDRSMQMRVAECLKRLGWVKDKKKKVNGNVIQVWRSQPENGGWQPGDNQVATKVATPSNPDISDILEKRLLPLDEKEGKTSTPSIDVHRSSNPDSRETGSNQQGGNQGTSITPGDEVKYCGTEYRRLEGKKLTVTVVDGSGVWCKKPDGFAVGPMPASDLSRG